MSGLWNTAARGSLYGTASADHPGARHARDVAKRARENPGEWVELSIRGNNTSTARSKAHRINHTPSAAFQPRGAYEARSEMRDDGYAVLVRFLGWPASPP